MKNIETLSPSVFIVIEAVVVVTPCTALQQHPSSCVFVSRERERERENPL